VQQKDAQFDMFSPNSGLRLGYFKPEGNECCVLYGVQCVCSVFHIYSGYDVFAVVCFIGVCMS